MRNWPQYWLNVVTGKVVRIVKTASYVTIFNKTRQVVRATEDVVTHIRAAAVSSVLVINERKTKYVNKNVTDLEKHLIMDGQVCEGVQNPRYIGTLINSHKTDTVRIT